MAPDKHSLEQHRSFTESTGVAVVAGKVLQTDGIGGVVWGDAATSGGDVPYDHGNMGATETLDFATNGTWHRGNLNVPCVITVTGFTVDEGLVCLVELTGTGGITWDADVDFGGGGDQPNASGYTAFVLWSSAGDADIKGAKVGGSGGLGNVVLSGSPSHGDIIVSTGSLTAEWTLSGRHLHITNEPMLGDGSQTVFLLAQEADDSGQGVAAYVNGVRTDTTLGAMNDRITFATAPPAASVIRVDYLALST